MTCNEDNENLNMLLNAYLDGQLSPAKAQKVEKLLAEDPDARQMLAQLRSVAAMVHSLPRCQAPKDLAEGVITALERDSLLDKSEVLAELAGQKHLRLRRFIAAAAMILLVGAAAMMTYNVLRDPFMASTSQPSRDIIDTELAKNDTTILLDKVAPQLPAVAAETTAPASKAAPSSTDSRYSAVNLTVKADAMQTNWDSLDKLLANQKIEDVVHTSIDQNHRQYAFLCSMSQLRGIFNDLRWTGGSDIDMVVTDKTQGRRIVVNDVTETELMALAKEANPRLQLVNAMQIAPADRIDIRDENTESQTQLMDLFAKAQPELTELRPLGPSQSSPRLAKKPDTAPLAITANATPSAQGDFAIAAEAGPSVSVQDDDSPAEKSVPAQIVAVVLIIQLDQTPPQQPQSPPTE